MCGIAGYASTRVQHGPRTVLAMLRTLRHRGPDDEGFALLRPADRGGFAGHTDATQAGVRGTRPAADAVDFAHTLALGHRRFSIVDLSPGGHQPFWSADGRIALAFNGEIYNHVELRDGLSRLGHRFRTGSDTEVLVAAYGQWGVDCLARCNGFFAIALFDRDRGQVLLARDRIGKAPLYVSHRPDGVWWASEIKALRAVLPGPAAIDARSVDDFVSTGRRDLDDRTFFAGITALPAGTFAWIDPGQPPQPVRWWSLPDRRRSERELPVADAVTELRSLLTDAVRLRLRADVPVGVELSGGLDSSTIVALLARLPRQGPVQAFTVSYPGSDLDELPFARAVVDHLGPAVQQTVLTPGGDQVLDELDGFVAHMDEPFHNLQLVNHQEIWRRMHAHGVRVSLNGAAADETLAGYGSLQFGPYLRHLLRHGRGLRFLREFLAYTEHVPGGLWPYLRRLYHLLPDWLRPYRNRAMVIPPEIDPWRPAASAEATRAEPRDFADLLRFGMQQWPLPYYCRTGNQSSMGVPLEFRCPFLDHRVVEFAFTLPPGHLIRDGWLKWLLRRVAGDLLPPAIAWRRRKGGFRYPLAERLPAARARLCGMLADVDCPHVDAQRLIDHYDTLRQRDPDRLWRLFGVALWWKRCIQGLPLERR